MKPVILLLLCFYYTYAYPAISNHTNAHTQKIECSPSLCNKTYFVNHVAKKGLVSDVKTLIYMSGNCQPNHCSEILIKAMQPIYLYDPYTNQISYGAKRLAANTSCWGYNIQLKFLNDSVVRQNYVFEPERSIYHGTINAVFGETYSILVCPLPRCSIIKSLTFTVAKDECEISAWKKVLEICSKNSIGDKASCNPPAHYKIKRLVGQYCSKNKKFTNMTFYNQIEFNKPSCTFTFHKHTTNPKQIISL